MSTVRMTAVRQAILAAIEADGPLSAARGHGTLYRFDAGLLTRVRPMPKDCPAIALWPVGIADRKIDDCDRTEDAHELGFQIVDDQQDPARLESVLDALLAAIESAWPTIRLADAELVHIIAQQTTLGFFEGVKEDPRPMWSAAGILHCDYELEPIEE